MLLFVVVATVSPSGEQSAPPAELPPIGHEVERALARGESHDWTLDLAAGEILEVAVEPRGVALAGSDEWPGITVTAPDRAVVFESIEPAVTLSIEMGARMVASLLAEQPGTYRLRVAARHQTAFKVPYTLRVVRRGFAAEDDRTRLAAQRLWHDGMHLFLQATPESRRLAVDKLEEARRLLAGIGDDENAAMTLGSIATVWYQLSEAAPGSAASRGALEIWRRLGRDREAGITLSDLGLLAYLGYDHPTARKYYEQALPLLEAANERLGQATTLVRMGWLDFAAGDMGRVIDLNHRAIPLWREAGDYGGESVSQNDLGRAYSELGEVSLALDSYQQALLGRPPDRNPRGASVVMLRMGQLYLSAADWQRAFDAMREALVLARRANDRRNEAAVLSNLGLAYSRIGDHEEARRYLEPAIERARQAQIKNAEANSLAILGVEAYLAGELEKSRGYFEQALAIQTAISDVRGQAVTLRYLATTELAMQRPQAALDAITRSLEKSAAGGATSVSALLTLASIHDGLGDAAQAETVYQRALEGAQRIRARDQEAAALAQFARFEARRGAYADARDHLEQALTIHESLRGLLVDPDQRMSYSSNSVTPYEVYIDVLMALEKQSPGNGFAAEAFRTAERARGRGLLELLATSSVDIRQDVDVALIERERTLRWNLNAKAAIQTALLAGGRDERKLRALETEIAELSSAWRDTTTRIRQQSPAYASLAEPQPLSADDVGRLLDERTVLLELVPGEAHSWLFAVTRDGFDSVELPSRRSIEDAAREVRRLLTSRQPVAGESAARRAARIARDERELADRARTLSDLVLGPVADRLAGEWRGRRLAIVASGALEYVPFAALPLPGARRLHDAPLVARHEIVTLPSASSLDLLRRERAARPAAQKTIAVFADPVFGADDPRVKHAPVGTSATSTNSSSTSSSMTAAGTFATRAIEPFAAAADGSRGSLARLPFSRAEALAVASQVPRTALLQATDFDATLALATSGRLNDYRIVHFATHGLINTTRPELSGLALSLVDSEGRSRDGFLRLNTIYNLRLSADLVVLSACQSALGKEVAGEGLVGLTRGFMYAGARRVIASLWQVSDVATAELMKRFYDGLLQRHLPAAAALRNAQLEMARDPRWASPYFWAGFVLQGDWQ